MDKFLIKSKVNAVQENQQDAKEKTIDNSGPVISDESQNLSRCSSYIPTQADNDSSIGQSSNITEGNKEREQETPIRKTQKRKQAQNKKIPEKKPRFVDSWTTLPEFQGWLAKSDTDQSHAYCKVCKHDILGHKSVLLKHMKSEKHKCNWQTISENKKITAYNQDVTAVRSAELKLCGMLATNNLSYLLMDTMTPLLKNIFPDSKIVQQISLKRTKATALIRDSLGETFLNDLYEKLKALGFFFSLVLDETTDISVKKQCAISVIYFSDYTMKVEFFDLIETSATNANDLFDVLKQSVVSKGIPLANLVGFSTDTTNVMAGEFHSVYSLLRADIPDIVYVKCSCHMAHLAASKACMKLPKHVEDLLRNIAAHFNRSPSRIKKFEEFQLFFQVKIHKILSPSQTRWLSVKACVDRVLEQYEPLQGYLRETVFEDPSYITESMLDTMSNKFTKIYLEFMSYSLELMTNFNLLFQTEKPLLYRVRPETESLLRSLCLNYIEASVVRKHDIFTLNHENPKNFVALDKIYIGISASASFLQLKEDPTTEQKDFDRFFTSILSFYIELVSNIKQRFQFKDPIFDIIEIVEPSVAQSFSVKTLIHVFERFPVLKNYVDPQAADNEWRKHALLDSVKLGLNTNEADKYWAQIFQLKNEADAKLFPNLEKIFSLLLVLPFSNAIVERVFSDVFNIKTDKRNLLSTANMRALLATKDGIKNCGGCEKFTPSKKMLHCNVWKK